MHFYKVPFIVILINTIQCNSGASKVSRACFSFFFFWLDTPESNDGSLSAEL